jgi:hypothetical protein
MQPERGGLAPELGELKVNWGEIRRQVGRRALSCCRASYPGPYSPIVSCIRENIKTCT